MENGQYKISNENRLTTVENQYKFLRRDIQDIKDNHIKHLTRKVDRIQWLLITTLIAVVLNFISSFIN